MQPNTNFFLFSIVVIHSRIIIKFVYIAKLSQIKIRSPRFCFSFFFFNFSHYSLAYFRSNDRTTALCFELHESRVISPRIDRRPFPPSFPPFSSPSPHHGNIFPGKVAPVRRGLATYFLTGTTLVCRCPFKLPNLSRQSRGV